MNFTLKTRILVLIVVPMLAISLFFIVMSKQMGDAINENGVESFETNSYKNKEKELQRLLEIATDVVRTYHEKAQQPGADEESLKQQALDALAQIRFGHADTGYFWVNNKDAVMVMHPTNKDLIGQDLSGFQDSNGVALFRDLTRKASTKGSGFVRYVWDKPGEQGKFAKLSYGRMFQPWGWVIATGVYIDDIEKNVATMRQKAKSIQNESFGYMLALAAAFLTAVIVFALIVVMRSIVSPINSLKLVAKDLYQGEGDLTKRLPIKGRDEISQASEYVNGFIAKIEELIANAKQSSSENASISHELSTTATGVGSNVEKSVGVIDAASAKAGEIKNDIVKAIEDAQKSKKEVVAANTNLGSARDEIVAMSQKVQDSAHVENELAQKMNELSDQAGEVKSVLDVIADIADQTNLLALNAAIEAARAGEHGRGFAVVADEVRKLAERTQKSLVEINSTISVIVQSVTEASDSMNQNAESIRDLASDADMVQQRINETVSVVDRASNATDKTVGDFEKTGKEVEEITAQVSQINTLSSNNARSVEEIASAADHLNAMTDELNNKLEDFKTS